MRKFYLAVIVLLLAGFSLTVEAQKRSSYKTAKAGVGFDGVRVGKTTRADIIRKYGRNFKALKHYDNSKLYSVQMKYKGGMSFYYCAKDKRQQIFDIELRAPLKIKTAKGIILSKSKISQLRRKYGRPRKKGTLRFRGIEFYHNKNNVITVIDIVEKRGMRVCG